MFPRKLRQQLSQIVSWFLFGFTLRKVGEKCMTSQALWLKFWALLTTRIKMLPCTVGKYNVTKQAINQSSNQASKQASRQWKHPNIPALYSSILKSCHTQLTVNLCRGCLTDLTEPCEKKYLKWRGSPRVSNCLYCHYLFGFSQFICSFLFICYKFVQFYHIEIPNPDTLLK